MDSETFLKKLEERRLFGVFNETLKLYQVMIDEQIIYITPSQVESMVDDVDLESAILPHVISSIKEGKILFNNGEIVKNITLH